MEINVWKPDGTVCNDSKVSGGDGAFYEYYIDGTVKRHRHFSKGVEIEGLEH